MHTVMPRLHFIIPLALVSLASACIDIPEVVDPPVADSGSEPPPDAGQTSDAGPTQTPSFTLTVSPFEDSVFQGEAKDFQVDIIRTGGFTDGVSLSLVNAPTGITAQPVTIPAGSTSAKLRIAVSTSAEPGSKTLTVRAVSGSLSREASLLLSVTPLGDLLVRWTAPSEAVVYANASLTLQATVEGGTPEAVELREGSVVLARVTTPPYTYSWNTTQVSEGEHHVAAYALRGGQEFASLDRTVIVDRTAPTIATRTPAQGESNVSVRTPIEVTFSEPLKASTVTAANVTLASNGTPVAQSASLSGDGRRLTLTPAASLPTPSTMTVNLGTPEQPVTDLAGNAVVVGAPWTFSAPVWQALGGAISAYPGATPAENVVMKLDLDGKPVIAWSEFDGTAKNIHVAQWNGASWAQLGGALSALSSAQTDTDHPALVITPTGQIIVAWDEKLSSGEAGSSVYLRKWSNGTWTPLPNIPISGSTGYFVWGPALAATLQESLYLYVTYQQEGTSQVHGFHLASNASSWNTLSILRPPSHLMSGADAVANQGDSIYAAYDTFSNNSERRVVGVLKNHSQLLGGEIASSSSTSPARNAELVIDGAGVPMVAWDESTSGSDGNVYFTKWLGSTWQTPVLVSDFSTANSQPALAMGDDGRPAIAWSGFFSAERAIYVSRLSGASWEQLGTPLSAASGSSTPGFTPSLVLDRASVPIVAWHETDGATSNIYVRRYNQ